MNLTSFSWLPLPLSILIAISLFSVISISILVDTVIFQMVSLPSLCSYSDPFTTQWPERASQNAHFSLCPLHVDILVIPNWSQDENVILVPWPVWAHNVPALPTPWPSALTHWHSLSSRHTTHQALSWLQALTQVLPWDEVTTTHSGKFSEKLPLAQKLGPHSWLCFSTVLWSSVIAAITVILLDLCMIISLNFVSLVREWGTGSDFF